MWLVVLIVVSRPQRMVVALLVRVPILLMTSAVVFVVLAGFRRLLAGLVRVLLFPGIQQAGTGVRQDLLLLLVLLVLLR